MRDDDKYNELIDLIKLGESRRLNELINDLRDEVIEFMQFNYTPQYKEAEEHTHNAICQLLYRLNRGNFEPVSVGGYTAICAKNDYFQKYKRDKVVKYKDLTDWIVPKEPEPLAEMYLSDARRITERAINRMSETAQRVTRLYMDVPDLDYKDAADIIGVSRVNVRTIKSRSFATLRERLAPLLAVD